MFRSRRRGEASQSLSDLRERVRRGRQLGGLDRAGDRAAPVRRKKMQTPRRGGGESWGGVKIHIFYMIWMLTLHAACV